MTDREKVKEEARDDAMFWFYPRLWQFLKIFDWIRDKGLMGREKRYRPWNKYEEDRK